MKRNALFCVCFFCITASLSYAEAPKKGRIICEGDDCNAVNIPTGSMDGKAWGVFQDSKNRVASGVKKVPDKIELEQPTSISTTDPASKAVVVSHKKMPNPKKYKSESREQSLNGSNTNLPQYYAGIDRSNIESSEKVVFVPKGNDPKLKGLKSGDIVWAVVEQEITASPEVPTPVRAMATSGIFKGSYFVGEAKLDRELKRILFNFSKLRIKEVDESYALKASGLSPLGSIGLEGEYVSHTGKFFIAELASAAATGFVDSTINRNQTSLGTYVQEPSVANSGKTAAVAALSKTTERMADAVRTAPEYTHIQGYQEIQVIIQDDPVELN